MGLTNKQIKEIKKILIDNSKISKKFNLICQELETALMKYSIDNLNKYEKLLLENYSDRVVKQKVILISSNYEGENEKQFGKECVNSGILIRCNYDFPILFYPNEYEITWYYDNLELNFLSGINGKNHFWKIWRKNNKDIADYFIEKKCELIRLKKELFKFETLILDNVITNSLTASILKKELPELVINYNFQL